MTGLPTVAAAEELRDVWHVVRVLNRYAWSLDTRNFDGLHEVFATGAVLDYGSFEVRGIDDIVAVMVEAHEHIDSTQHLLGGHDVEIDGDTARARCQVSATLRKRGEGGPPRLYRTGAWFEDDLTRAADGWRIRHRRAHGLWQDGDAGLVRAPSAARR